MPAEDRKQWIAILDAAAQNPPDAMNSEWEWLMDELGLPFDYYLAVREAVQQGRWRKAKNPRAYIKAVSKREAVKMGLVSDDPDSLLELVKLKPDGSGSIQGMEQALEHINYVSETEDLLRGEDGVWRQGGGRERNYDHYYDDYKPPISKLPENLKVVIEPTEELKAIYETINASTNEFHWHLAPKIKPNWREWAKQANFDEWEQLALQYKADGKSREKALTEQPNEASRRALQAAWKKFDRTGMERLQNALKINSSQNVPDDALSHTR